MKSFYILLSMAVVACMNIAAAHAQGMTRTVALPYTYNNSSTGNNNALLARIIKLEKCGAKKMFYTPADATADADGCVAVNATNTTNNTTTTNTIVSSTTQTVPPGTWCGWYVRPALRDTWNATTHCQGDSVSGEVSCPTGYTFTITSSDVNINPPCQSRFGCAPTGGTYATCIKN